jgi:hypothetical protein
MLNELIERYSQYSDPELMEVYLNKNKYTDDAKQAIDIVIEKKVEYDLLPIGMIKL